MICHYINRIDEHSRSSNMCTLISRCWFEMWKRLSISAIHSLKYDIFHDLKMNIRFNGKMLSKLMIETLVFVCNLLHALQANIDFVNVCGTFCVHVLVVLFVFVIFNIATLLITSSKMKWLFLYFTWKITFRSPRSILLFIECKICYSYRLIIRSLSAFLMQF